MIWPFTLTSRHVAELAAKDRVIAEKDRTIAIVEQRYMDGRADNVRLIQDKLNLQAEVRRLRKYEPVRDPVTGRWGSQRGSGGIQAHTIGQIVASSPLPPAPEAAR